MLVVIIQLDSYPARAQVRLLVEEGKADVNVRDRWGATPLDEALRTGHPQVSKAGHRHNPVGGDSNYFTIFELPFVDGGRLVACKLYTHVLLCQMRGHEIGGVALIKPLSQSVEYLQLPFGLLQRLDIPSSCLYHCHSDIGRVLPDQIAWLAVISS